MADEAPIDMPPADDAPPRPSRAWVKPAILLIVVVGLFVAAKVFHLGQYLTSARGWIESLGPWGPIAFIAIYVIACVAMVPGTVLTAAAGGLFGGLWGTVYVSIGSTLGATLCFVISRYFARDSIHQWLSGNERFARLDRLTESHGGWIVAITRLVPVFPFNLLNYGFGLTRVRLWHYVLLSWLCMLPGTVMYVVGADAIFKGIREGRVPWELVGVVGGVLALLTGLTWFARGKLRSVEQDTPTNVK
ncbi:MAG: hypothetical protein GC159_16765 [Phycisphaera sp.]|nr:hypothetical protein [Phycisphaera sp.]